MLGLVYRDVLPQDVVNELDQLTAQLSGFLLVAHNEDGTIKGSAIATTVVGSVTSVSNLPWVQLCGNSIQPVMSSAPDWVPADGTVANPGAEVLISATSRGSENGTVTVRMCADSGSVQARLYNVTDGYYVGLSTTVSTPTYDTRQFAVLFPPDDVKRRYRLELLPSVASSPVTCCLAYLE